MPGQQRRGCDGEDIGLAPAGYESCQRGEPHPIGRLVSHPASVAAQYRVLVPEHQQFSILRQVRTPFQVAASRVITSDEFLDRYDEKA
jgi:hypothetical protein